MKKWSLGVAGLVVVLVIGSTVASASSMPAVENNTQTTLTVVFGVQPEFDPEAAQVVKKAVSQQTSASVASVAPSAEKMAAVESVPEPSTLILLGMGVLGLLGLARRKM